MASSKELMRFGRHKFYVNKKEIRSFKGLKIKAVLNTEEANKDAQKYVSKKGDGALEVTFTAVLDARLGNNVYKDAMGLIDAAMRGEQGKLYFMGGKKVVDAPLMATDAELAETEIISGGKWLYAEVLVTLKQCGTSGSSSNPSGGGSDTSTSSGSSTYTVQVPGMSAVKVTASSVQGAITKAVGSNWTGTIYVNGTAYYVVKGKITPVTGEESASPSSTTPSSPAAPAQQAAQEAAENAQQAAQEVANVVNNIINGITNLFGGGNK